MPKATAPPGQGGHLGDKGFPLSEVLKKIVHLGDFLEE